MIKDTARDHILGKLYFIKKYRADGSRYEGAFENGKLHGEGIQTEADGVVIKGVWN